MTGITNKSELETIQWQLEYYAKHTKHRLFGEKEAEELMNRITTYLNHPYYTPEQKKSASASILWSVKKHIPTPFQKDAINIINTINPRLSLDTKDKENFLNFMVSSRCSQRFSNQSYVFFSDYEIKDGYDKAQNAQIFYKVAKSLEQRKLPDEEYQKRALNYLAFLHNYAKQAPVVNQEMVEKYTHIFFKMADRFPVGTVPFAPYLDLFTRTERLKHIDVKMKNMFGEEKADKPKIDKKAVNSVVAMYKNKVLGTDIRQFDSRLHQKMTKMLGYLVQNYDYSPKDVTEIQKLVSGNGYSSPQQAELNNLGKSVLKAYKVANPPKKTARKPLRPFTAMNTRHWEV